MTERVKIFIKDNSDLFNEDHIDEFFNKMYYGLKVSEIQEIAKMLLDANIHFTSNQIFKDFSHHWLYSSNHGHDWATQYLHPLQTKLSKTFTLSHPVDTIKFINLMQKVANYSFLNNRNKIPEFLKEIDTIEIYPFIRLTSQQYITKIMMVHCTSSQYRGMISFADMEVEDYEAYEGKELFLLLPDIGVGYNQDEIVKYIEGSREFLENNIVNGN